MKSRWLSALAFLSIVGLGLSAVSADTFKLDPVHSMVIFKIKHMDVSYVYGRFNEPTGTFTTDDGKEAFDVTIKTANVDTDSKQRDTHLKSDAFFNAKQYPEITFKSTDVKKTGDNSYDVTGDLSLHGTTKSITVTLNKVGEAQTQMGHRAGFEGTFSLKRSDYGMNGMVGPVGDDVTLMISFEGAAQ